MSRVDVEAVQRTLRDERRRRHMSQPKLARETGIDISLISRYETGRRPLNEWNAVLILEAFLSYDMRQIST